MKNLTLDRVWIIAGLAFLALRPLLTPIPQNDFWWHMATGRLIVAQGAIPQVDSFSYTQAGQPFYNQSWLAQVLLYGLHQLGGVPLIVFAQALLIAGAYGLLLRLCLKRTGSPRLSAGFLLLGTMPASFDNWIVRPQTYALAIFIGYLYLLTRWRMGGGGWGSNLGGFQNPPGLPPNLGGFQNPPGLPHPRPPASGWIAPSLLLLPLLGVVWVNTHGSFVLGGALIFVTFVGEWLRRLVADRREARAWAERPVGGPEAVLERPAPPARPPLRQLFLAGVLTGLAWLVNPGGLQVLGYVRNLVGSSAVTQLVTEWAPPTIRDPNGAIFFLFIIAGVVILTYGRRRPDPVDLLIAGAFLWLALGAVRNNIWFVAVATPLLVTQLATWGEGDRRPAFQGAPAINAALVGVFGLLLLLALPWVKPALGLPPELGATIAPTTPVAAVERLRADPDRPARLFHAMAYGSYLIWAAPEQKVWADPRIELYPFAQWIDYQRLSAGLEAPLLLDRYQVDGLLLSQETQAGLITFIKGQPDVWELRYEDEEAVYFLLVTASVPAICGNCASETVSTAALTSWSPPLTVTSVVRCGRSGRLVRTATTGRPALARWAASGKPIAPAPW